MPKSVQAKAKGHLHDIWQAETKAGDRPVMALWRGTDAACYAA